LKGLDPPALDGIETRIKALVAAASALGATVPDAKGAALWAEFHRKIAIHVPLGPTAMALLQAFANVDVTAERMAQVIRGNPYFETLFHRVVESVSKREQAPSTEAAIVLMGIQNSRNLIIANQMLRTVRGGYPEWTKEGKLKVLSSDILKIALRCEEALSARKDPYADLGFVGGVLFDLVGQIGQDIAEEKKRVAALIDAVQDHGLKSAAYAPELSRGLTGFPYGKFASVACLVHDIGKPVMAILDRRYLAFQDEMIKKDVPRALRFHLERSLFGTDHARVGAAMLRLYPPLRAVAAAISHHHAPFFGGDPAELGETVAGEKGERLARTATRQLAALVSMASNMASKPKKLENPADPAIASWKGAEFGEFEIAPDAVVKASQSAG